MVEKKPPAILLIGTFDTKSDELNFMRDQLQQAGAQVLAMDVSILGDTDTPVNISKHEVATAGGHTIADLIALADENNAMTAMAAGARTLAAARHAAGDMTGMIALGGTMGTDLALDVAADLPLGVPKMIVSTIAFSPLLAPERLASDLMMIAWTGGLYGLNSYCRATLAQACGAVVGAARQARPPPRQRPAVAMSSLGLSCLSYMKTLTPALEKRGYEVVVFHTTGPGGRAMETLARDKHFVAVLDLCLQEVVNGFFGSPVNSGAGRFTDLIDAGLPLIIAPGASDLLDLPAWQPIPDAYKTRSYHAHNRIIGSVTLTPSQREDFVRDIAQKLGGASAPTAFVLPRGGIEEWDRPGQPMHDPHGLAACVAACRQYMPTSVALHEINCHINDDLFCTTVLDIFDQWVHEGHIQKGIA